MSGANTERGRALRMAMQRHPDAVDVPCWTCLGTCKVRRGDPPSLVPEPCTDCLGYGVKLLLDGGGQPVSVIEALGVRREPKV